MATTAVGAAEHWLSNWYNKHAKAPWTIVVRRVPAREVPAQEPMPIEKITCGETPDQLTLCGQVDVESSLLDAGGQQSSQLGTDLGEGDLLGVRLWPNRYREVAYSQVFSVSSVPICLMAERLSRLTAAQLLTALTVMRRIHGLELTQGLNFLVHVFLLSWDRQRSSEQRPSVLDPMDWRRFRRGAADEGERELWANEHVTYLYARPLTTLERLLTFWNAGGAGIGAGFVLTAPRARGPLSFETVPPQSPAHGGRPNYATGLRSWGGPSEAVAQETQAQYGRYVFRPHGNSWDILFDGERVPPPRDRIGMWYVRALLRNPGHPFSALELRAAPTSLAAEPVDQSWLGGAGHGRVGAGHGGEAVDKRTMADVHAELLKLAEERACAEADANTAKLATINAKTAQLAKYLRSSVGRSGRPRKMQDDAKRAADSVRKAIKQSMAEIRVMHQAFAEHLGESIGIGPVLVYSPANPPEWEF